MISPILSQLPPPCPWHDRIHWFDCVTSTNDLAKEMAAGGAPHGTVLIADCQTGGRGRIGRSFHSPGGMGIYMSVILRPNCRADELMHLTCAAAVAMCDAVEEAVGFRPGIKWTNDLVQGGRKLAGILTELSLNAATGHVDYVIVGIGINCCQTGQDFGPDIRSFAGSLAMFTGHAVDRAKVAACMIKALHKMDAGLLTGKQTMLERYRADCVTIGKDVSLVRADAVRYAHAFGVDDSGALLVSFPDGAMEAISSGEVSVRGMYGYV